MNGHSQAYMDYMAGLDREIKEAKDSALEEIKKWQPLWGELVAQGAICEKHMFRKMTSGYCPGCQAEKEGYSGFEDYSDEIRDNENI